MRERIHFGLRLAECDLVPQPRHHAEPEGAAASASLLIHHQRSPEIEIALGKARRGRCDASHLVSVAAQLQLQADEGGIGAEPAKPELMADDDLARTALLIVAVVEVAAKLGTNAHHSEKVRGDLSAAKLNRFGAAGEDQTCGSESGHALQARSATPVF